MGVGFFLIIIWYILTLFTDTTFTEQIVKGVNDI